MPQGVLHEVVEDALNAPGVHEERWESLVHDTFDCELVLGSLGGDRLERVRDNVLETRPAQLKPDEAGIDLRQLEKIVDQLAEILHLSLESSMVTPNRRFVGDDTVVDALDHGADRGQWAAEIVRNRRNQLPPGALQLALPPEGDFEIGGHRVEGVSEALQLVVARYGDSRAEAAGPHLADGFEERANSRVERQGDEASEAD